AALYEKHFFVLNSDMKIQIPQLESFVYPDAVVVFEKPLFYEGRTDVVLNPLLIVEVASRSTRKYDRTTKFEYYKTLPSFKEYVLIEQTKPWVIASYKIADRTWQDTEAFSPDGSVYLRSVDCNIELKKVYHGVPFDKAV
ncbi:MAG: Uma2 family endonuclease, partial [Bacteroidota bacterium]|nr:Uma2 family endonuclease [Bacteroidota bacterium]